MIFIKMLDSIEKAHKMSRRSGIRMGEKDLKYQKDHTNYPRRFKRTGIPAFDPSADGFDQYATPDIDHELGSIIDKNY